MPPVIEYGMGSSYDAPSWPCSKCGNLNLPTRHLLFQFSKYYCACGMKFTGDFRISIDDIKVNTYSLLGKIHYQNGPRCVAHANVHALQFMERLVAVLMKQDLSLLEDLNPDLLFDLVTESCSAMADKGCPTTPIRDVKMVHTALMLKEVGLPGANKVHKVADVTVIPKNDFEAITTAIAEGEALVSSFYSGKRLHQLRYGQIYKPYNAAKHRDNPKKKMIGHAVCLVGAGREDGKEYFDVVNSHKSFCVRRNSRRIILKSGIGRISASDLKSNVIRLCRVPADADDKWRLQPQDVIVLNEHNRRLMRRLKPPQVVKKLGTGKPPQVVGKLDVDDAMEGERLDSCVEESDGEVLVDLKPSAARSRGGNGRRRHRFPRKGMKITRFMKWLW